MKSRHCIVISTNVARNTYKSRCRQVLNSKHQGFVTCVLDNAWKNLDCELGRLLRKPNQRKYIESKVCRVHTVTQIHWNFTVSRIAVFLWCLLLKPPVSSSFLLNLTWIVLGRKQVASRTGLWDYYWGQNRRRKSCHIVPSNYPPSDCETRLASGFFSFRLYT